MSYFGLIKSILVFIICFLMLELSFGFLDLVVKEFSVERINSEAEKLVKKMQEQE